MGVGVGEGGCSGGWMRKKGGEVAGGVARLNPLKLCGAASHDAMVVYDAPV